MESRRTQIIDLATSDTDGRYYSGSGNGNMATDAAPVKPRENNANDMRQVLKSLLERKWLVLGVTLIAALISLLVSLSITPIYRAETTLKIAPEQQKLLEFDVGTGDTKSEQYFRTQQRLLKSKALAREVISALEIESVLTSPSSGQQQKPLFADFVGQMKEKLGFAKPAEKAAMTESVIKTGQLPTEAEQALIDGIGVEEQGKSYLLSLTYDSTDPDLAAAIVNSLATNYIEMTRKGKMDSATDAKDFLSKEMEDAKATLSEAEDKLIRFEKDYRIIRIDGDGKLMAQKLSSLNAALNRATEERISAESNYREMGSAGSKVQSAKTVNRALAGLEDKLSRLNKQYQENLKIYKPGYPLMQDLQQQMAAVKQDIAAEQRLDRESAAAARATGSSGNDLGAKVRAARAKEEALKQELENAKTAAIAERDRDIEYETLQQEVKTSKELFESLTKRQKEVGVAGGVEKSNITIVDTASPPQDPFKPNIEANLVLGSLLGLLAGSLFAIVLGHLDDRIKSAEDIARVSDLPVFGIFPFTKSRAKDEGAIRAAESPNSAISEAFRSLRTNMMFATPEGLPKILHITSSEPAEGKSNTSMNLAGVFAQSGKTVLLIDADLRKPSVNKYLQIEKSRGLGHYLIQDLSLADVITPTYIPNLSVIAGKALESTPADLLSSDKLIDLLDKASDKFDLIIIDSPPVMGLADSLVLANRSSASLVVVACNETTRTQLTSTLNRLRMGYGNVIGFVMTKAKKVKSNSHKYEYGGEHISGVAAAPRLNS